MRIAITPRFFENKVDRLLGIERKYYSFFEKYGHNLHLIPFTGISVGEYFDDLNPDLIVFAGGYRLYSNEIKNFETKVLKESLKRKLPILGICCGMWTINYYFKGTLKFNESHQAFDGVKIDIKKMLHKVKATDFIEKGLYTVNTFHSKVIDVLGEGLKCFLMAEDNTIEGFYDSDKRIIGIQFHMENKGVSNNLTKQLMKKIEKL